VCIDETSKQLVAETRAPLPASPGQPERVDYEYERQGTANLCMVFEPLAGQRRVKVTERRTAVDFAHLLQEVVAVQYPQADKIVLVMDNLNTHKLASLYEAFAPAEARRLMERLEIHYTPKHGSWLNMAETELSVLATQLFGPADSQLDHPDSGGCRLGAPTECRPMTGQLALHDARCPHQTEATLPINSARLRH